MAAKNPLKEKPTISQTRDPYAIQLPVAARNVVEVRHDSRRRRDSESIDLRFPDISAAEQGITEISLEDAESKLAGQLLASVEKADGFDIIALRDKYKLKQSDLERLTGFSIRALADWSAGKIPSEPAKRRLREIHRLLDSLAKFVKIEAIPIWLRERNPSLDKMTPLQVIEVGEIDRLWQMVYGFESDAAT